MKRTVRLEVVYPYPVEQVWRALTDKAALSQWFMETGFEPVVGKAFTFKTKPAPGFDGVVRGEVMEVDAPHHLAYTWRGGPLEETVVRFWLEPDGNVTRLRLEHSGFSGAKAMVPSVILGFGWRGLLRKDLPAWLEARQVSGPESVKGETR